MSATSYMDALSRQLGEQVALSEAGQAALTLDGRGVLLRWEESAQRFMVHVEIGPLAGWRDGEVCKLLLAANFMLLETDGGALSYNPASNMVGLNCPLAVYGLEPQGFLDGLNRILALAGVWRERLARMGQAQEQAATRSRAAALALDGIVPDAPADEPGAAALAQSMQFIRV